MKGIRYAPSPPARIPVSHVYSFTYDGREATWDLGPKDEIIILSKKGRINDHQLGTTVIDIIEPRAEGNARRLASLAFRNASPLLARRLADNQTNGL